MKKIVLFIIAVIAANSMNLTNVNASTQNFYEGEYVGTIYMRRNLYGEIKYQRARFFRQQDNGNPAYCIEPFANFKDGQNYTQTDIINNLSEEKLIKMSLLAYYGYLYPGHEDTKWYAITQQLIWKTAEPMGIYQFTQGLNGETIYPYEREIEELTSLVNAHLITPSFAGSTIDLIEGEEITLTDNHNVLKYYEATSPNAKIDGNKLTIKAEKEGSHQIKLIRKSSYYNAPALFYYKGDEQKVMTLGNAKDITTSIYTNIRKTEIEITKIDKDTETTTPSGEASLIGAKYGLYDSNNTLIEELTIGKDNKTSIKNLKFGTYILKELQPGIGYKLDENIYKIELNKDHTIVKLVLKNEVIKKKIEINKEFGIHANTKAEPNVTFDIYDSKDQYVASITTDENGYAKIELPYGKYTIKQKNTTENYKPVEDFSVTITEEEQDLNYHLYDYKIEVPNTRKTKTSINFLLLIGGFYVIKKYTL